MPRRSSGGGGRSSGGFSRSSGGKSSSWFSPRPAASTPARNPPQPAAPAPPPAPIRNGSAGGIGSTIREGMAFGGGSAIAHRAVDSVMGPRVVRHETVASAAPVAAAESAISTNTVGGPEACGNQFKAFQDCLNYYGSDISKCQFYMDMLSECRKSSSVSLNA